MEDIVILCSSVAESQTTHTESDRDKCATCGQEIWVATSSREIRANSEEAGLKVRLLCNDCLFTETNTNPAAQKAMEEGRFAVLPSTVQQAAEVLGMEVVTALLAEHGIKVRDLSEVIKEAKANPDH